MLNPPKNYNSKYCILYKLFFNFNIKKFALNLKRSPQYRNIRAAYVRNSHCLISFMIIFRVSRRLRRWMLAGLGVLSSLALIILKKRHYPLL